MKNRKVEVFLGERHAGTLAETAERRIAFAYTDEWLRDGFVLSPFSLPMEKKVFIPAKDTFHGLWGVFADSLPDAWGRLLTDRMLSSRGYTPGDVTELERLLIVGESGMGALVYRPAWETWEIAPLKDLDLLCNKCRAVLQHEVSEDLDELFRMGGSSGGARPKVMTEEWIVKFPSSGDMANVGTMEKEYMDCAQSCGIRVPETKLIPSRLCDGYFAIRRFDREQNGDRQVRRHVLTAAAILETDWRTGTTDYHTLMKLTKILSRSNETDLLQMYRRMCFNVFAHNRDDHLKNFSWIYDESNDCWRLSPAYDLTWSTTWFGEHTLQVNGNSRDPGMEELLAVGTVAGIQTQRCRKIAEEIREIAAPLEEKYRDTRS